MIPPTAPLRFAKKESMIKCRPDHEHTQVPFNFDR